MEEAQQKKLPELINAYGLKHVMVVYDSGVRAAGIADKVLEQIHKTGGSGHGVR